MSLPPVTSGSSPPLKRLRRTDSTDSTDSSDQKVPTLPASPASESSSPISASIASPSPIVEKTHDCFFTASQQGEQLFTFIYYEAQQGKSWKDLYDETKALYGNSYSEPAIMKTMMNCYFKLHESETNPSLCFLALKEVFGSFDTFQKIYQSYSKDERQNISVEQLIETKVQSLLQEQTSQNLTQSVEQFLIEKGVVDIPKVKIQELSLNFIFHQVNDQLYGVAENLGGDSDFTDAAFEIFIKLFSPGEDKEKILNDFAAHLAERHFDEQQINKICNNIATSADEIIAILSRTLSKLFPDIDWQKENIQNLFVRSRKESQLQKGMDLYIESFLKPYLEGEITPEMEKLNPRVPLMVQLQNEQAIKLNGVDPATLRSMALKAYIRVAVNDLMIKRGRMANEDYYDAKVDYETINRAALEAEIKKPLSQQRFQESFLKKLHDNFESMLMALDDSDQIHELMKESDGLLRQNLEQEVASSLYNREVSLLNNFLVALHQALPIDFPGQQISEEEVRSLIATAAKDLQKRKTL